MLIAWVPVLFIIIGLLMYFASKSLRVQHLGLIIFACAMLVTLQAFAHQTVTLLGK